MPATKGRSAATQLTGTGNGTTLSISTVYGADLALRHVNGSGTITTQGSADVEVRTNGGTEWYTLTTVGFGQTASGVTESCVSIPPGYAEVRLAYTAPVGSTGHTLDYEVGVVTGL